MRVDGLLFLLESQEGRIAQGANDSGTKFCHSARRAKSSWEEQHAPRPQSEHPPLEFIRPAMLSQSDEQVSAETGRGSA
jgi:hypothetical protein